jgi:twitching motility protein PilI
MSKRFNLREFQQEVLDKLQAQATSGKQVSTLGVQIGAENWLIDMADIGEVLPPPALTAVPLTQNWFCGVANVRGNLCSVIDLAAFMQQPATTREVRNRVLLLSSRFGFNTGLLVSQVLGLRDTQDWQLHTDSERAFYQDEAGVVWHKLDIQLLINQPEFLQISA